MTPWIVLSVLFIAGISLLYWKLSQRGTSANDAALKMENAELKLQLQHDAESIGSLQAELENEKHERSELQGKGKELSISFVKLEAKHESTLKERDELKRTITKYESEHARRDKDDQLRIAQLAQVNQSLTEERQRVLKAEEEQRQQEEEERDRIWADHEISVIAAVKELCKHPQYNFTCYTNTNLPEGLFDGSFKPDCVIDFLGQYLIFDAKASKAESLQTYINNAVTKTTEKVKKNKRVYPIIFLVVPTQALRELKKFHYTKDDYTYFVIGAESLAPVLFSLKRITHYELAEQMDPQKRENIINLISELDFHINMRNSADLVLTKMGMDILEKGQRLDPEIAEEVAVKKKEKLKNIPNLVTSAMKKMVASTELQQEEVDRIVSPKAAIRRKDLESSKEVIMQSLV